jgi:hypothetical protein
MPPLLAPPDYPTAVRVMRSFDELCATPLANGVNALCWERTLPSGFAELVAALGPGEGLVSLDARSLRTLPVSAEARAAADFMLADFARLRARELDPVLNCIHAYPHDDADAIVATDVYSFHADRAPVPAETWLCTYHGAPSEGLRNEEARRRVEVPATRAQLLAEYGQADDAGFAAYLAENCYDLHYEPLPHARLFSFGVGHLWRIALAYPGNPVPPCIHRAPRTGRDAPPRLLLIS